MARLTWEHIDRNGRFVVKTRRFWNEAAKQRFAAKLRMSIGYWQTLEG